MTLELHVMGNEERTLITMKDVDEMNKLNNEQKERHLVAKIYHRAGMTRTMADAMGEKIKAILEANEAANIARMKLGDEL